MSLKSESGLASLTVVDSGPGIPEAYREKVFGRLYRLDDSRSTPGSGLGLSLVWAVGKSHGLSIDLFDNTPGLVVTVRFPEASIASDA